MTCCTFHSDIGLARWMPWMAVRTPQYGFVFPLISDYGLMGLFMAGRAITLRSTLGLGRN